MLKYQTVLLVLGFSLAATAGGLVLTGGIPWFSLPPAASPDKTTLFSAVPPPPRPSTSVERPEFVPQQLVHQQSVRQRLAAAVKTLAAGDLLGAQDEYLMILLSIDPNSKDALHGLVAIRRRLSHDDSAALRRDANTYRRAMSDRTETKEHYSPRALQILADASLAAADEVERSRKVSAGAAGHAEPRVPSKRQNSANGRTDVTPVAVQTGGTSEDGSQPRIDSPARSPERRPTHRNFE